MSKKENQIPKPHVHRLKKPGKFIIHKNAELPARHDYSAADSLQLGRDLNGHLQRKRGLEAEKKAITADYNSQIKRVDQQIEAVGQRLSDGFEMKPTQAVCEYDYKDNKKRYYRSDRNPAEFLKDEALTDADKQTTFGFETDKPKADPASFSNSVGEAVSQAEKDRADEAKSLKARRDALENPQGD